MTVDNSDELKSLTLTLRTIDPAGKVGTAPFKIKVNKPKIERGERQYDTYQPLIMSLSFSLVIPDHIHQQLIGQTVPKDKRSFTYPLDLPKTIKREHIGQLTEVFGEYVSDCIWLRNINERSLTQVIFFDFSGYADQLKSTWDGKRMGHQIKIDFLWLVGYITTGKRGDVLRYNEDRLTFTDSRESEVYACEYVLYTEARYQFFTQLEGNFATFIQRFENFSTYFYENDIDTLIGSNQDLLTHQ